LENDKKYKSVFLWLIVFGVAMGLLEAIIVVYIRQIYYPTGFEFPLKIFALKFYYIEILREIATIVMLISIGVLAGKNLLQRFCFFLFSFAVWDIFYYIGLKLILDWPPSLLTWDILFLIPVTWTGPVLAPIISSLVFIVFSVASVVMQERGIVRKMKFIPWLSFFLGVSIVFLLYIRDFSKIIIAGGYLSRLGELANDKQFISEITNYIPEYFNWYIFIPGELLIILTPIIISRMGKSKNSFDNL
jgi:hypothetical protein